MVVWIVLCSFEDVEEDGLCEERDGDGDVGDEVSRTRRRVVIAVVGVVGVEVGARRGDQLVVV